MWGKAKILSLLAFVLVLACAVEQPSGDAKFITLDQEIAGANVLSLLNYVHDELVIGYAFFDNNGCSGRYTDSRVQGDIGRVLDVWLEPLRGWSGLVAGKGPIVATYTYVKGEYLGRELGVRSMDPNARPHLWVVFACREGRSFYSFRVTPNPAPATIVMFSPPRSNNREYSLSTLLHEVGHAFGLSDTYVENSPSTGGTLPRYNESDCGVNEIVGCQPLAVMNITNWLIPPNAARIAADDIAGIRYVYRDIHAGEKTCPAEYTPEMSTGGCKPKNPLVFAIMNGDTRNAEELIKESGASSKKEIADLINKKDKTTGSTFLHYAAMRSASHGGESYRWLIEKGADVTIKNNDGKTARDLLLPQIEKALDTRKTDIAESLMSQALKD